MVTPALRTAITSHGTFSVLKRYTNLVEIVRSISPVQHRNLVPRALFPGFGGGEKRPGDEVGNIDLD